MKVIIPSRMSSCLAEEIGWHLGDGSMNVYKGKGFYQLRGHFEDDKPHYEKRIGPFFRSLFGVSPSMRLMRGTGVYGFQVWSDELVRFKKELGLPLGRKKDFRIPQAIHEKQEWQRAFVRGFFDTDGCLYVQDKRGKPYPRIEMGTVCEVFAEELRSVLVSLGFRPTFFRERRDKQGWQDFWRLRMNGFEEMEKWFRDIKPMNPKFRKKKRCLVDTG